MQQRPLSAWIVVFDVLYPHGSALICWACFSTMRLAVALCSEGCVRAECGFDAAADGLGQFET
jgi:hypothetical protein